VLAGPRLSIDGTRLVTVSDRASLIQPESSRDARAPKKAPPCARNGRFPALPKGARERQDSTVKRALDRRMGTPR
jgi:hypothetical protein